jgi:hypothetical protein
VGITVWPGSIVHASHQFSYTTDQDRLKGKAYKMKARRLSKKHQQVKRAYDGSFNGRKSNPAWRNLTPIGEGQQDGEK